MKKIIISMLAMAFMVLGTASFAYADTTLNQPGSMPTLTISNATTNPCDMGPIDGCWRTSATARPGDIVTVHIYYKNTGRDLARETTLSIRPKATGATSSVTFTGGVASLTAPRAVGSARLNITSPATVTYRAGSARWYPSANSTGRPVDQTGLFGSSGFNIGTLQPGEQGVLVADFLVGSGTIDNDECEIDSFTADDYSINRGDSTRLRWTTTGCDYVNITSVSGNLNPDGSVSVSPASTRTYTLTAYPGGDTRTVRINVDEDDQCSIDSFTADDYTLSRGQSTTLRWRTTGMDSVDITPGYSNQSEDGSVSISPTGTTTYTLRGDGCSSSRSITVTVADQSSRPQAVTTAATILSSNSARLNGIALPNTTVGTTSTWFEWGPSTSLGYRTTTKVIASNTGSNPQNDFVSGLVPNTSYYYRIVVQNQNGIAYGEIVRFQTARVVQTTTVTTPPTRVIVQPAVTQVVQDVVVAQSAPSLLELRVETTYDRMCIGGQMDYTVIYRNISGQTLENAILQFTHPKEVTYISATRGEYEVIDRVITLDLGDIQAGEEGVITIRTRINDAAIRGNLTVTTATVVYTNTITRAQEDAIAYSLITVSDDCPNVLGASVFGFGSFLPDTLLEWLLLILVILALILLGRQLYRKREQTTIITQ